MNAAMFMFLFADVQVTFLQPVLLKLENHIFFCCTERKWVLTFWLKLQEILSARR